VEDLGIDEIIMLKHADPLLSNDPANNGRCWIMGAIYTHAAIGNLCFLLGPCRGYIRMRVEWRELS
jgi:hypothetical protein